MKITKDDVGRKVKLRNGTTTTIKEWCIDGFEKDQWPVILPYRDWPMVTARLTEDGRALGDLDSPLDIVAWADEPDYSQVEPKIASIESMYGIAHTCTWTYPGFGQEEWCTHEGCKNTRRLT